MTLPLGLSPQAAATGLILISAVLHAVVNSVLKASGDILVTRAFTSLFEFCCFLPLTLLVPLPDATLWGWLLLSTAIHYVYHLSLVNAYRLGDLSAVYPVARGLSPLLTGLGAVLVLGESVSGLTGAGLVAVCLGLLCFGFEKRTLKAEKAVLALALLTGVLIASYTVVDSAGVRHAQTALGFIFWFFVLSGLPLIITTFIKRRGAIFQSFRAMAKPGLTCGLLSTGSFGFALLALRLGAAAEMAALRETSVVIAALIGVFFLGEGMGKRRIAASLLIAAGAIVMQLG